MVKCVKGQAVFEFVVAAVLFFGIVFYIINFLNVSVSTYSSGSRLNELESKAMDISEFLMHVNLTDRWPVLSYSRIGYLGGLCISDIAYDMMLKRFDIDWPAGGMVIGINEGSKKLLDCGSVREGVQKADVERFAVSENKTLLNVTVSVW